MAVRMGIRMGLGMGMTMARPFPPGLMKFEQKAIGPGTRGCTNIRTWLTLSGLMSRTKFTRNFPAKRDLSRTRACGNYLSPLPDKCSTLGRLAGIYWHTQSNALIVIPFPAEKPPPSPSEKLSQVLLHLFVCCSPFWALLPKVAVRLLGVKWKCYLLSFRLFM